MIIADNGFFAVMAEFCLNMIKVYLAGRGLVLRCLWDSSDPQDTYHHGKCECWKLYFLQLKQ